jgi:hypothetical protein
MNTNIIKRISIIIPSLLLLALLQRHWSNFNKFIIRYKKMDTTRTYLIKNAEGLIIDKRTLTKGEIETKYAEFKLKFPKFYDLCISGGNVGDGSTTSDAKILSEIRIMLGIREELLSGQKSNIEANVQVSEYFAKQFVYPIIGEPTQEQKKAALQKIIKGERDKKKNSGTGAQQVNFE